MVKCFTYLELLNTFLNETKIIWVLRLLCCWWKHQRYTERSWN